MLSSKIKKLCIAKNEARLKPFILSKFHKKLFDLKLNFEHIDTTHTKQTVNDEKVRRHLEKEYTNYLTSPKLEYSVDKRLPKIVWWLWLQGFEKAPRMVKLCLYSIKQNFKDYQINIITKDNLKDYIDIPDFIQTKVKNKIITFAQYSDIIRVMLLAKYGGVWIDSTVFCSNSNILPVIENNDFFVYKNGLLGNNQNIKLSSWFISSKKGNVFIQDLQNLFLSYWESHDYMESYFLVHLLFTLVTEKYPEEWEKIPSFNNVSPHMMVRELNNTYSLERYQQLDSFSSMHKLNHHIKFKDSSDTLYGHLLKEYNL